VLLTVFADASPAFAVAGVAVSLLVAVLGLARDLVRALGQLPDNYFGLCRLGPSDRGSNEPALTDWLHERLQTIAGKWGGEPLTFADLWGVAGTGDERQNDLRRRSRIPSDRNVDLQMMTTNLTHGRPMRLPQPLHPTRDHPEDGGGLLFDPDELRRFFPADVVTHLERCARPQSAATAERLASLDKSNLRHFPVGGELPVIVATRMSLSFPVLISAIPLWELDFQNDGDAPPLRRVVFSDGGITSNFPVHFFDSPLPIRPTFGLHLTGFANGEVPNADQPCAAVADPAPVAGVAQQSWVEFDSMFGFATAIKDAMQNWRDNAQGQLPGFRERIIHIKLAAGEGGLNLAMKGPKILELTARGRCAGERLVELFGGDRNEAGLTNWNNHRFARYRTTMSLLEQFLRSYHRGYTQTPPGTISYRDRVVQGSTAGPYQFDSGLSDFALQVSADYQRMVEFWNGTLAHVELGDPISPVDGDANEAPRGSQLTLSRGAPRPSSTLRGVPPV
jgi:hypothetical protein